MAVLYEQQKAIYEGVWAWQSLELDKMRQKPLIVLSQNNVQRQPYFLLEV